jgi:hypothetical protein
MGGTCNTHGRDEKCIQDFGRKTERENHQEDLDVDVKVILR